MIPKILLATNNIDTYKRFLKDSSDQYTIKTAAYNISNKEQLNIDYCLDSLISPTSDQVTFNGNFRYYSNEIKNFSPDLVISDCELYTSTIAIDNNFTLWQVSPMLFINGIIHKEKYNLGITKKYNFLLGHHRRQTYLNYVLNNSNRKLIYSYLCDSVRLSELKEGYEWVRPDFLLDIKEEDYKSEILRLSDKFYNQSKDKVMTNYMNIESILYNSMITKDLEIEINDKVKFLKEYLDETFDL